MILSIYLVLFGITLFFFYSGLKFDMDVLKMISGVFLFICGGVLEAGQLQYKTGYTTLVNGSLSTTVDTLTTYKDHFFGYSIMILGIFIIILAIVHGRANNGED